MNLKNQTAKILSRTHSVFWKLIVSYIVLVFLVAVGMAGLSFLYFQGKYNVELVNFHHLYLRNIERELYAQVVKESKAVSLELTNLLNQANGDFLSPYDVSSGTAGRIYSTYKTLNAIVARHVDGIDSIHLYFIKDDLLVSSSGYQATEENPLRGNGRSWHEGLVAKGSNGQWTVFERPEYFGIQEKTLFRNILGFPAYSPPEEGIVVVCIDFNASALRETMNRLSPSDIGLTALMCPESPLVLGSTPEGPPDRTLEGELRRAMSGAKNGFMSKTVKLPSGPHLLSVLPLAETGWYLTNSVSDQRLYRRGEGILTALVILCLAAIVLGATASLFLTSSLYNPLARLMSKLGALFGIQGQEPRGNKDEYEVLDSALDGISGRMDELRATAAANRPVIKGDLMIRLLEGEWIDQAELRDTMALIGIPGFPPSMRAGVVTLTAKSGADRGTVLGSSPILKYRIADDLERSDRGFIFAAALPGSRVGFIAGTEETERGRTDDRLPEFARAVDAGDDIRLTIAEGEKTDNPGGLGASFATALSLAEYRFLYPETPFFADRPDLLARSGHSGLSDKGTLEDLAAALKTRDIRRFRARLDSYTQAVRKDPCPVHACLSDLERFNKIVSDFAVNTGIGFSPPLEDSLHELLTESGDIFAFMDELSSVAADLCASDDSPQVERNTALTEKIKVFVRENLESDLSLNRVGNAVAVSPGYMCKIFKEETGTNFVAYVTETRLAEAAKLLSGTRHSVQEIAKKTGFNTPAYFIRLFKDHFGNTPLEYRRNHPSL